MRIPTIEQMQDAADKANGYLLFSKETKAPIFKEGFMSGASYMEQQLEPIITDLEMQIVKLKKQLNERI